MYNSGVKNYYYCIKSHYFTIVSCISFIIFITGYSINASISHSINNQLSDNENIYGFVTNFKISTTLCEPKYITCYNSTITFYVQKLNMSCEYHSNFVSKDYYTEQEFYDDIIDDYPIYSIHPLNIKEKYNTCTIHEIQNQKSNLSVGLILNMLGYLLTVSIFFGYIYYKINKLIINDDTDVQNKLVYGISQNNIETNNLTMLSNNNVNTNIVTNQSVLTHTFDSLTNKDEERAMV